jgi:hypothetical protein
MGANGVHGITPFLALLEIRELHCQLSGLEYRVCFVNTVPIKSVTHVACTTTKFGSQR